MTTLARLDTVFGSNVSGLISGIASARSRISAFNTEAKAGASQVGTALSAVGTAGAAVGVALAAATVAGISTFQQVGGEVRTLEMQLGTTAEQASVLRAQGDALGVSTDKLSVGFGIFSKHLVANDDVLGQYGLTVARTADGQIDFGAEMQQLSAVFGAMPPGMERTAAAMNLFGRSGKTLLPLLAASSDQLAGIADNAKAAGLIMSEDDVQAARDLSIAQRELGEAFKGLEVSLARAAIPMLKSLVDVFSSVVRGVSPLLPMIRDVGIAFLAWKTLSFLPTLIEGVAVSVTQLGLAMNSSTLLNFASVLDGWAIGASTLVTLAAGATLFTGALVGLTAALVAWDPLGIVADQDELNKTFDKGSAGLGSLSAHISAGRVLIVGMGNAATATAGAMDELNHHANRTAPILENITKHLGLGDKAFDKFKAAVVESAQVSIGQFKNVEDAFQGTTRQLLNQANAAVNIARQEHSDLHTIFASKDLSDAQKQALASLPADQRRLWAEGGKAAKEQIAKDAVTLQRLNDQNFHQMTASASTLARAGGHSTGMAFTAGAGKGIVDGSPALEASARNAIELAIQAGRDAAGISSPSKVMAEVGQQLMQGLSQGIDSRISHISSQMQGLVGMIRHTLGVGAADQAQSFIRDLNDVGHQFDRLAEKISSFRDAINQGFSSIDLVGTLTDQLNQYQSDLAAFNTSVAAGDTTAIAPMQVDLSASLTAMVNQATQMASTLTALQKAGLNQSSLSTLASEGPTGIALGQQLLQDPALLAQLNQAQAALSAVSQSESDKLINREFGDKVSKLGDAFDGIIVEMDKFLRTLPLPQLSDKTSEFVDALVKMINGLNDFTSHFTAGGGGGGGGGNGGGPPATDPHPSPPGPPFISGMTALQTGGNHGVVTVHVHGDVLTDGQLVDKIQEGLSRKSKTGPAVTFS